MALEICRQHAQEGDAGELNAALRVFCRHDRLELVKDVLAQRATTIRNGAKPLAMHYVTSYPIPGRRLS